MKRKHKILLENFFDDDLINIRKLLGGCVASLFYFETKKSGVYVAKVSPGILEVEAWMLNYILKKTNLPVPKVYYYNNDLLVMDYIENAGNMDPSCEEDAAKYLASLHSISNEYFGLERDTPVGGVMQKNSKNKSWINFFLENRLQYMAQKAYIAGAIPKCLRSRFDSLSSRIDNWISEPKSPSLIHGDMWSGNILVHKGYVKAFIDPAIYYADSEIELAFSTLFSTFGTRFFDCYNEYHPIQPDFFETRRYLYNLYPLLVHSYLFGGHYINKIDNTLVRLGV